ncbi:MAG TPA: pyruvate ferredoxin oxidoreductase [Candidatus Bathyarchaeia archaeon]|nr:pyruvate ferredoxin oxidoreductase [Candidatus Bathyarchaeia archaeon]
MTTQVTVPKPVLRKKYVWTGTRAVAEAVKIADVDVIAAYPIRPYTGIMNDLAKMVADGDFQAEVVVADSEHSQFEVVKHASAVGARTFVGSSGVGLAYAAEAISVTALGQLPVVAVAGCRALDDPGNFGMEWNDVFLFRDVGWLVSWAKDPQESLDMTLVAYRVAEDRRVLLPHFVAMDGAAITHVSTPVETPPKDKVTEFLPPYKPPFPLDPAYGPVTKANHIAPSLIGPEQRKLIDVAMKNSVEVIREAWKDYYRYVGKQYSPFIESTLMEDADIVLVSMGAYTKDAIYAAKRMREKGIKTGVVRLRYWRPFPGDELRDVLLDAKAVGVLDFSYSMGSPDFAGAFFNDVRSTLYQNSTKPPLINFILAGGREPTIRNFEKAIQLVQKAAQTGSTSKLVHWLTLRGEDV